MFDNGQLKLLLVLVLRILLPCEKSWEVHPTYAWSDYHTRWEYKKICTGTVRTYVRTAELTEKDGDTVKLLL